MFLLFLQEHFVRVKVLSNDFRTALTLKQQKPRDSAQ